MQRSDDNNNRQREEGSMEFLSSSLRAANANYAHSSVIMRAPTQNNNNNNNSIASIPNSNITSPSGTNKQHNFNNPMMWPPTLAAAKPNAAAGTVLVSTPGDSHSSSGVPTPPLLSDPSPERSTSIYTIPSGRLPPPSTTTTKSAGIRVTKKMMFVICGLVVIFMIMLLSCQYNSRSSGFMLSVVESPSRLHSSKSVSHVYPHPRWRPKGAFVSAKAVYESDRVSIEEHSVRLSDAAAFASDAESGADKANVVHNWIWINQPDQINALVYLGNSDELATTLLHTDNNPTASKDDPLDSYSALSNVPVLSSTSNTGDFPTLTQWLQEAQSASQTSSTPPERLFLMFRQRKYGYEGHSLAVVGGAVDMIDKGSPVAAAQRELLEELGIVDCPAMDATNTNNGNGGGHSINNNIKKRHGIIHLGGYRSDTNRGGGVVYTFVASRCPLSANASFVAVPNYKGTSDRASKKKGSEKGGFAVPPKFVMQSADGDLESQGVVLVTQSYLTEGMIGNHRNDEIGMQGVVKEVKWAATVAMAILRLSGLGI